MRAVLALLVTATLMWKLGTTGLAGEEMLLLGAVLGGYGFARAAVK